ncbi:MAG TPA: portal protein [Thermoanaerobaculia bacterium]
MGTSLLPELGNVTIAGGGSQLGDQLGIQKRQRCEVLRGQLELERFTFWAQWKDLAQYILPRRPRFTISDVNKGDRRNQSIIDSTATECVDILRAGMMTGMTSPARPWFRLITGDPDLDERHEVKEYLHEVQTRMEIAFLRSNLYDKLPVLYGDMAVFGTGTIGMMEDSETIFRFYDFPVGSYSIANDAKMRIRVFCRTLRFTVRQMVDLWGGISKSTGKPAWQEGRPCSLSVNVQNLYERGNLDAWVDVCHLIQPNVSYDGRRIEAKYKRFEEVYYELGSPNNPYDTASIGLLSHSGFDEFPILVGRWEVNSEDVYATNCPGMKALGDIRQLQMGEKRSAQGIEKTINPPLTGPTRLMNNKISVLPGDFTGDDVPDAKSGIRPIYQFDFAAGVRALEEKQQQVRGRVEEAFKKPVFLMFADDRRDKTATEVAEMKEEKLLVLGPMLWQFNGDVLKPLIDRGYNIMNRKRLLPPPPPVLQGMELHVEFVSIMAQAQKAAGIASIERFAGFTAQIADKDPSILDNIDDQELLLQYADATGVPPKILRSEEQVTALRTQRAKAAQAQQAAENAPKIAAAAKGLGAAPQEGSPLAHLLASARARQQLDATAQPVGSVLP